LDELRYWYEFQVLNSKNFGVPQNRERVFIIGHLRNKSFKQIFPLGKSNEKLKLSNSKEACAITSSYSKGGKGNMIELTKGKSQGMRVYSPEGISQTISSIGGGQGAKTGLYAVGCALRQRDRHNKNEEIKQQLELRKDSVSNALTSVEKDSLVSEGTRIRRLTPIECERLQGFPDNWTKGLSDTQRYKCLGNAVTTNVIQSIGEMIK
jgi:DNA (cytosine-5)-methyltransferase 1